MHDLSMFCRPTSLRALGATFIPSFFILFSILTICSIFTICTIFFYETIFSSSPYLTHFILPYILRYHYYTCVVILYTCVCTRVLAVMVSIVYNLNQLISSTLFVCFFQSSYRPVQSHNVGVFVILIMIDRILSTISTPTCG